MRKRYPADHFRFVFVIVFVPVIAFLANAVDVTRRM